MTTEIKVYLQRLIRKDQKSLIYEKTKLQEQHPTHRIRIKNICDRLNLSVSALEFIKKKNEWIRRRN